MRHSTRSIALAALLAAPIFAQRYTNDTEFTVRRSGDYQDNKRDGKCTIRVVIDDEADVELQGDRVRIRTISGRPGRDQSPNGSECNSVLPNGASNFRFKGIDGRGEVRLVQEPRPQNRWTAVVNIRDKKGGDEGYTFDLFWTNDGRGGNSSGGGFGGGRRDRDRVSDRDGGFFPGGNSGGNNSGGSQGGGFFGGGRLGEANTSASGKGDFNDRNGRTQLRDMAVEIRGNDCRITLSDGQGNRAEFRGRVTRDQGNVVEVDLTDSNQGRVSGRARLQHRGGSNINQIELDGDLNGQRFTANWRR